MNSKWLFRLKRLSGSTILALAGSGMLYLSWFKWPDILIDYGRELYVPWQITQGKVLYRDIHHLYGPLAHYFNAFLFQVFGTGLSTLAYFNICLIVLLTFIIYQLFKPAFGDFIATTAGVCFLVVFAFAQYEGMGSFNFVCPYSHELTYGIFLFFLALAVFKKYLKAMKPLYAGLIGFILGLIFLTKVEIFLAASVSISVGFIFVFRRLKPPTPSKQFLFAVSFFFLPVLSFFIYFWLHMPVSDALSAMIASYKNIFAGPLVSNVFYSWVSGFDDPVRNTVLMLRRALKYLVCFILVGLISYLFSRLSKKGLKFGLLVIISSLVLSSAFLLSGGVNWWDIARPFPLLILFIFIYQVINLTRAKNDKTFALTFLPFILLVLFALLALLKMILNVHFFHYGFALAMPAALVMVVFMLYDIPVWISRFGNRKVAISFMVLFVYLTFCAYLIFSKCVYDLKHYPVAEGRDRFLTFNAEVTDKGPIMNEALRKIDAVMTAKDTFIVVPEGIMINYLTRRSNPSRYFEFTPNIIKAIGENQYIADMSSAQPSFIVLSDRETTEHGAKYFGRDYALNISSWINRHYDRVLRIGAEPLTGKGFGIVIAKKKEE